MTATATIEPSASTSIATIVAQTPSVVLIDEAKREQLYEHIQREVDSFEPDVSTPKGRDAIKSLAYKITRTKTAIDAAGKELNEEARAKINAVDAARRDARERLDNMAKTVRAPLTEWEDAEEKRIEWCREVIQSFKSGAVVTMDDTSETVRNRGKLAYEVIVAPGTFGDMFDEATAAKNACVEALKAALARLTKEEADRVELEKLRQEKEARDAREAEEQAERDRIEGRRKYARAVIEHINQCGLGMIDGKVYPYIILIRELEEKIVVSDEDFGDMAGDVEKARVETLSRVREAAAEQAERARREAAEEAANAARDEAERAKQAEIDAANDRAARAEAEAKAERDAQTERDRLAAEQADAEAEAQAKRDADKAHRAKVMTSAKTAIMSCGADEETARKIVLTIIAGEVPNVTLRF